MQATAPAPDEATPRLPSLLEASGETAILTAIERELRQIVAPTLSDPGAAATLDMIGQLMTGILARRREEATAPDAGHPAPAMRDNGLLPTLSALLEASREADERRHAIIEDIRREPIASRASILSREALEDLLRALMPGAGDLRVTGLERPSLGWGKVILMATLEGRDLPHAAVVVRQDAEVSATATCVADEYPIVRYLFEQGLPVPEPLHVNPLPGPHGQPFMILSRVPGTIAGDPAGPASECTREALLDLARFAARLHALDPRASGLPEHWRATPDRDANRRLVSDMRRLLDEKALQPMPLLDATLLWLERHAPPAPERPILVHTDLGLWNILVADGRVTGVLDWELARIGDPMQDLAYIRPLLADRLDWETFVAAYRDAGGQEYRPDCLTFYEVLSDARNAIFTELMHHSAMAADAVSVKTAFGVTHYLRLIERKAAAGIPGVSGRAEEENG